MQNPYRLIRKAHQLLCRLHASSHAWLPFHVRLCRQYHLRNQPPCNVYLTIRQIKRQIPVNIETMEKDVLKYHFDLLIRQRIGLLRSCRLAIRALRRPGLSAVNLWAPSLIFIKGAPPIICRRNVDAMLVWHFSCFALFCYK